MKFGVCTTIENSKLLKEIGYDYIEMGLSSIASLNDGEFETLADKVQKSTLNVYAFNVLFPGTIKVTGCEANSDTIKSYLDKAFNRAKALGGSIVVFGSGGSRRVPENFSYEQAFEQLISFLTIGGSLARDNGITIVVEPLRSIETNIINTASEGLELTKAVNHPNVRLLIDFYHMTCVHEDADIILKAGVEFIKHIHIANPEGRLWPKEISEANYYNFFKNLKKIGYDGGISIEGRTDNLDSDAPLSLECLKALDK